MTMARYVIPVALILLAGCGGGDHKSNSARPAQQQQSAPADKGSEGQDEEQDKGGVESLPPEDRRSFLQIGVASSNLSTVASLILVKGFAPPWERPTLLRLRRSVELLRPPDARLRRLRTQTLLALGRAIRAPRAARAMLADANRIQRELEAYSKAKPAIGGIAPE